ncbi:MAG: class I SAM-dependent RNA methyltransferase [Clostridiales bacterium]|nr:class I SAM-dependent RNA methyltransferase [Clostridiales bacterium]
MDMNHLTMIATAAFGLEGVVAAELKRLGMAEVKGEIGGARFGGSLRDAFLCNLRLRCADRVMIVLGERECRSFEELFQFVKAFAWEDLLPADAKINVSGKCARSQLMSVRDCQAVTKKAIIERLKEGTGRSMFPESGAAYPIEIALHGDMARLTLDTSGEALNRRGYRTWNGDAPLRETLAAALVELSTWRPGMRLHDPCCGTGTLLIEAAFRQSHRAPGLTRHFAMEQFACFPAAECAAIRRQCQEDFQLSRVSAISGSDIDPEALELCRRHVNQAGLSGRIEVTNIPLQQLQLTGEPGVFLCNPPYGERLSDRRSCEKLYAEMGKLLRRHPGWSLCAITSDPMFERAFGKRADKKRRLYNGRLECEFLIYK